MNDQPDIPPGSTPIDLTIPAIDIKLQLPLDDGSGRVLVFGTVVPQHCESEAIDTILDKLSKAGERQKALVLLPTYVNELEEKQEALKAETERLYSATQERDKQAELFREGWNRRGDFKLSAQQNQIMQKLEATVGQHRQTVRVLEKAIESETHRIKLYKARLGG